MGDETKHYTIQVKGTAYKFAPIPPEDFERLTLVRSLSTDDLKVVKAVTRTLANSAGAEAWDELTDRYINGELTIRELTVDVFQKIVERQTADGKEQGAKKTAKRAAKKTSRVVAQSELRPADAE